ncbi:MAG: hypothetical protein V1736_10360 [Pseudomonadota bacterium]
MATLGEEKRRRPLVRVITPVLQSERLEDAEARLQGFTKEIVPVLREFIPE